MKYIAISQPGGPEVLQIREGEIPTIGEHEAVSYTHLDVYKRQIMPWAPGKSCWAVICRLAAMVLR